VVDARDVRVEVVGAEPLAQVEVVEPLGGRAGVRQGEAVDDRQPDGADAVRRDDVAGERVADEAARVGGVGARGQRVVDGDARLGEVALALEQRRDGAEALPRRQLLVPLDVEEEEGAVAAVVEALAALAEAGDAQRAREDEAVLVDLVAAQVLARDLVAGEAGARLLPGAGAGELRAARVVGEPVGV